MAASRSGPVGDWKRAMDALDPARLAPALLRECEFRMRRVGHKFESVCRKRISQRKYAAKSPVTVALCGKSTPLVAGGDLFASVTSKVTREGDRQVLLVGVNRNAQTKNSKGETVSVGPIAKWIHDGFSVNVGQHPKVRAVVFAMLREVASGKRKGDAAKARAILDKYRRVRTKRGQRQALRQGGWATKLVWVVPSRPFITDVLSDPEFARFEVAEAALVASGALRRAGGR